jgi:predicted RNA binding protein YcfA (HicA-like mRNA interferase family)
MWQYPSLNYRNIVHKLKSLWFEKYNSRWKWSHEIWVNIKEKKQTVVPNHWNKDISIIVIKWICKHIWISLKFFYDIK